MLFQSKVYFFAIGCHVLFGGVAGTIFSVWSVQRSTATGEVCGNIWIFSAKWNRFILVLIAPTELEYRLYSSITSGVSTQLSRQRWSSSVSQIIVLFATRSKPVYISFVKVNSNTVICLEWYFIRIDQILCVL